MPSSNPDQRLLEAQAEFTASDRGWDYELTLSFGAEAAQARLEARGRGEPETPLRDAFERRADAADELEAATAEAEQDWWPKRVRTGNPMIARLM